MRTRHVDEISIVLLCLIGRLDLVGIDRRGDLEFVIHQTG
jgi:hypothetical protein